MCYMYLVCKGVSTMSLLCGSVTMLKINVHLIQVNAPLYPMLYGV